MEKIIALFILVFLLFAGCATSPEPEPEPNLNPFFGDAINYSLEELGSITFGSELEINSINGESVRYDKNLEGSTFYLVEGVYLINVSYINPNIRPIRHTLNPITVEAGQNYIMRAHLTSNGINFYVVERPSMPDFGHPSN